MTNHGPRRRADLKQVGHLYKFDACFGETICAYCGELATTLDHVMPVAAAAQLYDMIMADRARYRHALTIVPCCEDCNRRLGTRFFTCLSAKRAALAILLRRKHWRLLSICDWEEGEMKPMGRMLHTYIEGREAKRKVIEDRLLFASGGGHPR
jgi:hypothetical protein